MQLKAAGIETVATIINYDLPNVYYEFTNPNNIGWLGDKIQIALGFVFILDYRELSIYKKSVDIKQNKKMHHTSILWLRALVKMLTDGLLLNQLDKRLSMDMETRIILHLDLIILKVQVIFSQQLAI